jgi:hypothetical protein
MLLAFLSSRWVIMTHSRAKSPATPVLFLENFISFLFPSRPAPLRRKIQAMSRSFFLMGPSCGSIIIMKLSLTITTTKLDHTTITIMT